MKETKKLEILAEMKKRFPGKIRKGLKSLKFCSNEKSVFLEFIYHSKPEKVEITDLAFISNDELDGSLFPPEVDIIDNTMLFVTLDEVTLAVCDVVTFKEHMLKDDEKLINSIS